MSAAEQLEAGRDKAPARRDQASSEAPAIEAVLTEQAAKSGARLRPLLELAPYVARYRTRAILALIALTIAAAACRGSRRSSRASSRRIEAISAFR